MKSLISVLRQLGKVYDKYEFKCTYVIHIMWIILFY